MAFSAGRVVGAWVRTCCPQNRRRQLPTEPDKQRVPSARLGVVSKKSLPLAGAPPRLFQRQRGTGAGNDATAWDVLNVDSSSLYRSHASESLSDGLPASMPS